MARPSGSQLVPGPGFPRCQCHHRLLPLATALARCRLSGVHHRRSGALRPSPAPSPGFSSSLPGLGRRLGAPLPPPVPLPPVFWLAWRRRRRRRGARRRRGSRGWAPALAAGRHEYLSDCWGHEPCGVHCHPAAQDEDVSQLCGYVNSLWLRARRGSVGGGWVGGAAWMDVASDWHWLLSRALFDAL